MEFDLAVIGGGPGGYVAAIRASQLGMKTALIERYPKLGGTCLNVGCIPSKTLLDSSEHYHYTKHGMEKHGFSVSGITVDWEKTLSRKRKVVDTTAAGVTYLMKKNKITVITGAAAFEDAHTINVALTAGGQQTVQAKHTIIATGSEPADLPGVAFDKKRIISSTQALELSEIPKTMSVIGAGVIGLELGSVFARMGTEVTVIEYADVCVPGMDRDISTELKKSLEKIGLTFFMGQKVQQATVDKKGKNVVVTAESNGTNRDFTADYCLVAVGRRPYTAGLQLEKAGINLTERKFIKTNEHLQTDAANIFAIGDVVGMPMLAHKSEEEGVFVAEYLAGQKPHINYNLVPGIVYTHPEVGAVGQTEAQLKQQGRAYKTGKFPFSALGRARAADDTAGFVKILADKETDEVLGVHIIGPRASDLIAEAVTAMEFRASAEDIARICHGHPTYAESMREAALIATDNRPLNL